MDDRGHNAHDSGERSSALGRLRLLIARLPGHLGSDWLMGTLVLGLAGGFAASAGMLGIDAYVLATSAPMMLMALLIIINRSLSLVINPSALSTARSVALVGILVCGLGFAKGYLFEYEGTIGIGEAESTVGLDEVLRAGPLAKYPALKLTIDSIEFDPDNPSKGSKAQLVIPTGEAITLSTDEPEHISGDMSFRLTDASLAPLVSVRDRSGSPKFEYFMKLKLFPKGRKDDYFKFRELPYRFYLSYEGPEDKALDLVAMRGKLRTEYMDVKVDENLGVDRFIFTLLDTAKWAEIEVRMRPGRKEMAVGGLIAFIGFAIEGLALFGLMPGRRRQ